MNPFVTAARGWIGTPYQHQASTRGAGTDCLGLIRGVWRDVLGQEPELPPAYSMDWSEPQGEERLWQAALRHLDNAVDDVAAGVANPGDVLLFRIRSNGVAKHLGIASAPDRFIHAYSGHCVAENALTRPWERRIVARFTFPDRPKGG